MIDEAKISEHLMNMRVFAQGLLDEADKIERHLKPVVKVSSKKTKLNNIIQQALQKREKQLIKQNLKKVA